MFQDVPHALLQMLCMYVPGCFDCMVPRYSPFMVPRYSPVAGAGGVADEIAGAFAAKPRKLATTQIVPHLPGKSSRTSRGYENKFSRR